MSARNIEILVESSKQKEKTYGREKETNKEKRMNF